MSENTTGSRGMSNTAVTDRLLDTVEAAARCNRPEQTLRNWRHAGVGPPSFKLRGRVVYSEADLLAWLDAEKKASRRGDGVSA